jgi:aspartate/methionine/tyrosine aminotransferase
MFVWAPIPGAVASRLGSIDFAMKLLEEAEVAVSPGVASARRARAPAAGAGGE